MSQSSEYWIHKCTIMFVMFMTMRLMRMVMTCHIGDIELLCLKSGGECGWWSWGNPGGGKQ